MLIYGLFALKHGAESWAGYIGFLQNPVVVILNLITLAAALLHTKKMCIRDSRRGDPIANRRCRCYG